MLHFLLMCLYIFMCWHIYLFIGEEFNLKVKNSLNEMKYKGGFNRNII